MVFRGPTDGSVNGVGLVEQFTREVDKRDNVASETDSGECLHGSFVRRPRDSCTARCEVGAFTVRLKCVMGLCYFRQEHNASPHLASE